MQLYVGQSFLKGDFARYAKRFNFLELFAEPHRLPKVSRLASYAARAPADFVFSVVLSPRIFHSDEQEAERELSYGLSVQRATRARWLVLRTPPGLRPGPGTERLLAARLEGLREVGAKLSWEPRGLWQPRQAAAVAQRLGVQLVLDANAALEPGAAWGEHAYVRVLGLGTAARINDVQLERLVERWAGVSEAYVAVDAPVAQRIRATLVELLEYDDGDELDDDVDALDDDVDALDDDADALDDDGDALDDDGDALDDDADPLDDDADPLDDEEAPDDAGNDRLPNEGNDAEDGEEQR